MMWSSQLHCSHQEDDRCSKSNTGKTSTDDDAVRMAGLYSGDANEARSPDKKADEQYFS